LPLPGHTPGSVCYALERGGLRLLFTGDVVSSLRGEPSIHSPAREPLGTYSAYLPPRYRGDAASYLASLRQLRALPAPDLVLPGHPGSDPSPQSPAVSRGRWEAMLDQGIQAMEGLVARYERDGADFLDGRPKELLPGLHYLGDFGGRAAFGLAAGERYVVVGALGAPGFGGFLRESQRRLGVAPREPSALVLTGCGPAVTAGLREFLEKSPARVFAPDAGVPGVRSACPAGSAVEPATALARGDWFPCEVILLGGADRPAAAYHLTWAGKRVLFSDRMPILFDHDPRTGLLAELTPSRDTTVEFLLASERLARLKPDLWLPATPFDGQNANLYGREWHAILDGNLLAGAYRLGHL
jgi:glyoxylase-like metal-dependent hydrolase (beta-lactamase superfamily II)